MATGGDEDTKEKVATGGDEDTKEKVATGGDEDTQGNEENGGDQDTVGKEATGKRSPNEENSGDDDVGGPVVTLLDESALCKVCFGTIKTGLQAIECGCGSTYHLNCGRRVGACPGCDASFEALL